MKLQNVTLLSGAFLALIATATVHAETIAITNNSFEADIPSGTTIPGWTQTTTADSNGYGFFIETTSTAHADQPTTPGGSTNEDYSSIPDGSQYAQLSLYGQAGVSTLTQNVGALVGGETYTLSDFVGSPSSAYGSGLTGTYSLSLLYNGVVVDTTTLPFTNDPSITAPAQFQAMSLDYIAPIGLTGDYSVQLGFTNTGGFAYPGFDDVQLIGTAPISTPEPSTYALFALGFLGLLAQRLRQSRKA